MTQKVHLTISCTGLRDADVFSKSDPLCTVFDDYNNELGRTECIDNELNPHFKEKIILEYNDYEEQKLIFKLWDIDDYNNDINKADFLGEMYCTLEELVDCTNFSKPLRYQGSDFGKIFIKTEKTKPAQNQKGGKKGKKGKKGGQKKNNKEIVSNDAWLKEEMAEEVDDTFKSIKDEQFEEVDDVKIGLSDTMRTEAFTPTRFTPTPTESQFTPITHPLRPIAGADGYLSDPGFDSMSQSQYKSLSDSKPYHFIPSRTSLYDMSLTPLEDISCISPQTNALTAPLKDGSTIKRQPYHHYPDNNVNANNDTFNHLTGDYYYSDGEEDTYELLKKGVTTGGAIRGGVTIAMGVSTGTAMTPAPARATVNTATSPISPIRNCNARYYTIETQTGDRSLVGSAGTPIDPPNYRHISPNNRSPNNRYLNNQHNNRYNIPNNNYNNYYVIPQPITSPPLHYAPPHQPITSPPLHYATPHPQVTSPPPHPPSIHNIPKVASNELKWFQYSSSKEDSLWDSDLQESGDKTTFYSFNDTNRQPSPSRRPPVLLDFEETWDNVLNDLNSPDWTAVETQDWRTWFEFYKANSKVKKMRSLLVATMIGTRECVMRGFYLDSNSRTVQLPSVKSDMLIEDKGILQQAPISRFPGTDVNVINADPVQVCLHLQKSGYKPALFIPASSHEPGGEWRTGGIGPLEEFIRRSSYYTCVDNVDGPVKEQKRSGTLGLLSPTECQVNTNVTVFRESQQRNYMFLDEPKLVDVFSITPLPKVKKAKEAQGSLTKEEVQLLKRKLSILFYSAATNGSDCFILTPHLTEGRRVPHRHVAQIVHSVANKYSGMFKRVIVAIERDVIFHDFSKEVLGVYNKTFPDGHITLPSLPPLPASQDIILWHWMGDNNNWYPYDPKQNEVIDAIYLRGECRMSMKGADSSHPGYVVDFNHFTVKSLSSNASRKIGRFKLVYDKIVKKSASRPVGNWTSATEETNKLYQTAGEETLQLQQSVAVWQWLRDDNTWADYSTEQSTKLESAYLQHGTACVILHIIETRFSVNTKSRIQTNTSTGKQRKVQRVMRAVAETSPRATSTPTPPSVKAKIAVSKSVVWEHQGTDKSWLPFDSSTTELLEKAYLDNKSSLTVVFNNQAYWIYLNPYNILVDPKIMEEYAIRRVTSKPNGVKPMQLFQPTPDPITPAYTAKAPITPMSNSTMIEHTVLEPVESKETSALFTTASDFSSVLQDIKPANTNMLTQTKQSQPRYTSSESCRFDGNNNRMQRTFMRHPSITANLQKTSVTRDPSREFAWEWEDRRTGLWHTLPEFISCFLEPASKIQNHGGVRTSKLTHGQQQITVRADFNSNSITGHLPGRPDIVTPLRRVEVCSRYS